MPEKIIENKKRKSLPIWARIILILVSFLVLSGIFQFIGLFTLNIPLTDLNAINNINTGQQLIVQLFGFIALVLVVYIFRKFIDKESIHSMGLNLKDRGSDIIVGFILALILIGGGTLVLYALGVVDFLSVQFDFYTIILSFFLFIIVSLSEEVLMRGYILNNLLTSTSKYSALIISAIIFTLFHLLNSNLSSIGILNLFLAGVLLGSAYIFTKNLWFPISLHLFWNFLQGPIFGYSVSGQKVESLIMLKTIGDETLNGGNFGFEGSIIASVFVTVSIFGVILYFNKTANSKNVYK